MSVASVPETEYTTWHGNPKHSNNGVFYLKTVHVLPLPKKS